MNASEACVSTNSSLTSLEKTHEHDYIMRALEHIGMVLDDLGLGILPYFLLPLFIEQCRKDIF